MNTVPGSGWLDRGDGHRLAWVRTPGTTPGVMFLGGFQSDMTGTKALALEAHCRAAGRAFLRFDYHGHGASTGRFEDGTIGRWRADALAAFDALTAGPQVLVGSSMGGATALWLAVHHPERVARLVLYRVSYHKNEHTHGGTREMADAAYWRSVGLAGWLSRIHLPQGGPDAWEQVIGRVSDALDPATSDHSHTIETLRTLRNPTLVVCGDRDPLVPMDDVLAMYDHIPDCGLWLLPHATHVTATNTWRAEAFATEILRFLQRR